MASGLAALIDDVAMIAKLAAASIDDVGAAAGKAGAKAAGVVVDDTAVTPRYVTGFTPDRELPVIAKIARGSLRNKIFLILPIALLLSAFLPWAITPILMAGGSFLCFEGVEKALEAWHGSEAAGEAGAARLGSAEHEAHMISGAVRTDLILSAEIMAIALAEVSDQSMPMQAAILLVVALAMTVGVYGVVGLIVKMDDIGLHLAQTSQGFRHQLGCALVRGMPKLLAALSGIGIVAMMWVGGGIFVHGLHEFHLTPVPAWIDAAASIAGSVAPVAGGILGWLVHALGATLVGAVVGGFIVSLYHALTQRRAS